MAGSQIHGCLIKIHVYNQEWLEKGVDVEGVTCTLCSQPLLATGKVPAHGIKIKNEQPLGGIHIHWN